jgi:hypothetical protein
MFHLHRHVWQTCDSQIIVVADTYPHGFWKTEFITEFLQLCSCGKLRVEAVPYAWEGVPGTTHSGRSTAPAAPPEQPPG